jgi:hypothetical protein
MYGHCGTFCMPYFRREERDILLQFWIILAKEALVVELTV